MKKTSVYSLTGSALCLALGLLLPIIFHLFGIGPSFLPMHIPVLLCGFLFGWEYGAVCGAIVPLLSALLTGMPPIFPTALAMMLELCCYGVLTGLFYKKLRWNIYLSLIAAMLAGRVVSGIANAALLGLADKPYGFAAFLSSAFMTAFPGIVIQLVFIPLIVLALERTSMFRQKR